MREQTCLTHQSEMRRPDNKRGNRSPLLVDQTSDRSGDLTSPLRDQTSNRPGDLTSPLRDQTSNRPGDLTSPPPRDQTSNRAGDLTSPRTDQTDNRRDSVGLLSSGVDDRLSHDRVVSSQKVSIETLKNRKVPDFSFFNIKIAKTIFKNNAVKLSISKDQTGEMLSASRATKKAQTIFLKFFLKRSKKWQPREF
jgi:hypothetical protein